MGPGRGLGVVLDREERASAVGQTFYRSVVEIHVGHLHGLTRARKGLGIYRVAVILGADSDLSGGEILTRLIATVVTEFKLVRLPSQGEAKNLMTQTNPKERFFVSQISDDFAHPRHRSGITRAVGEKNSIGRHGEGLLGGSRRRDHSHFESLLDEQAKNVPLDPEIVSDQPPRRTGTAPPGHLARHPSPETFRPRIGRGTSHLGDEIAAIQAGRTLCPGDQNFGALLIRIGTQNTHLRAGIANSPNQSAGINSGDPRHPRLGQKIVEPALGSPVARLVKKFSNYEAREKGPGRLVILGVDPDVANLGISHGHDLTRIRGIGHDFLVPRHAGVEYHLTFSNAFSSESLT